MRKYELSVGYNRSGQVFFDTVYGRPKVTSWFFSLTHEYGKNLDAWEMAKHFRSLDTYGIPANLLLNAGEDSQGYRSLIGLAETAGINLTAVTVLDIDTAKDVRSEYPKYAIHFSVNGADNETDVGKMKGIVDVYNVSGRSSFNSIKLMHECHENNIVVKYIANEGCVVNCDKNFGAFVPLKKCNRNCRKAVQAYPWLNLATVNIYKEFLDRYPIDIVKLATRRLPMKSITCLLGYWCSNDPQTRYWAGGDLDEKTRPVFEKWMDARMSCDGYCASCKKCKKIYDKLVRLRSGR